MRPIGICMLLLLAAAPPLVAQGTLSSQGFGYPPGQLGTRSQGTAGASAEFDEESPLNPATILEWGQPGLHFQYDPEFRRIDPGNGRVTRTTIGRFPVIIAGIPVSPRGALALSAATLLDRTFETSSTSRRLVGVESLYVTEGLQSSGGMNDVRLGGAYAIAPWLRIGVAAHAITGESRVSQRLDFSRTDPDSVVDGAGFVPFAEQVNLGYAGIAFSAGADYRPSRVLGVALSARRGGSVRTTLRGANGDDSVLTRARLPDRWGIGLRYSGIAGTTLAGGIEWDGWSSLQGLGREAVARDAYGYSLGGETRGPRFLGTSLAVRAGIRLRTLPYEAAGQQVKERTLSTGIGLPVAFGRAQIGVSLQHAARSAAAARETGWTVGFGLTVRP